MRVFDKLNDAQISAISKRLGRPLTQKEIMFGEIDRAPGDPIFGTGQIVYESGDPIGESIREAEAALERERMANMTDAERRVHVLHRLRDNQSKADAAIADEAKRLEALKPQLEELRELREATRWDASFTAPDVEIIMRAYEHLSAGDKDGRAPDLDVGMALYHQAIATKDRIHENKKKAALATMTELEKRRAATQAEIDRLMPKTEREQEAGPEESSPKLTYGPTPALKLASDWMLAKRDHGEHSNEAKAAWLRLKEHNAAHREAAASENGGGDAD